METYAQVKRTPGKAPKVILRQTPPKDWDDSEEQELAKLAHGASVLAWKSLSQINKKKAAECRKRMLEEIKSSH